MELTLKRLLENAEFKKYRGKGYDPTEVDDFLDRATAMAAKVEVQLTQALEQARSAGGASGPGPDPAAVEAEIDRRVATEVAAQLAAQPAPSTGPSEEEVAAEAQRTLVMAQRTADAAVREARDDADKMVAAAKEQAEALLADAEARASATNSESEQRAASTRAEVEAEAARERREARQRLAAEIGELEGLRESLRSDVSVLERHVEEQRSQLGSTLAELQQILDDPSGFRLAPAPALSDPALPDFSDLDEPEPAAAASEPVDAEPVAVAPTPSADEPEPEPEPEAAVADEPPAPELPPVVAPEPVAAPGEAEPPVPPVLAFEEVDHEAPGLDDPPDSGPPTAPVSAVDLGLAPERAPSAEGGDEDAFLTELRKAMADEEPLGPRDAGDIPPTESLFGEQDRRGFRFGKRR
ncbi:MAG TPA: DivIVA domain-containing protein [Acidimicrobiales bacterium]|nr:DivIVA domain-containing protein [Acidimicrobiales bacterium]